MSDRLQRTLARFNQRIASKQFYEAHQTLRTIANRYIKARQFQDAQDLLAQGASELATNGESASAADLLLYLIQTYQESGIDVDSAQGAAAKSQLAQVVALMPDGDAAVSDVAKLATAWVLKTSRFGDPKLHHLFGQKMLRAVVPSAPDAYSRFALAEMHLILGTFESVPVYVDYLWEWYLASGSTDCGVFLARAVFNYLYLKNVKFAQAAVLRFASKLGDDVQTIEGIAISDKHPVFSLLALLVATVSKEDSREKFLTWHTHNKPLLAEHELVSPADYVGQLYYGLTLGNPQGNNNMLANLMGSLFK